MKSRVFDLPFFRGTDGTIGPVQEFQVNGLVLMGFFTSTGPARILRIAGLKLCEPRRNEADATVVSVRTIPDRAAQRTISRLLAAAHDGIDVSFFD